MNIVNRRNSSKSIIMTIGVLSLIAVLLFFSGVSNIPLVEAKYVFSKKWGSEGTGNGQFQLPSSVAIDSAGNVYVVDGPDEGLNNRVQKFKLASPCPAGTTQVATGVCFVTKWGSEGSGNGQFRLAGGINVDSAGNVYVADSGNARIQVFRANGAFVKSWGTDGTGNGQFVGPEDLAFDSSWNVYVTDFSNDRIQKFKLASPCPTGTTQVATGVCFVTKWGKYGSGDGEFDGPAGIAVDSSGIVYVADNHSHRIQAFASNGIFIKAWGIEGTGDGQFKRPGGIAVDSFGYIYVADTFNHRIQKFHLTSNGCPDGTEEITAHVCFVTKWGIFGTGNGQLNLPTDVAIGSASVFVAGHNNPNIQVFTWRPDVTVGAGGSISPK